MRFVLLVAAYLGVVMAGAAAIAPWVWRGAHGLAEAWPAFASVANQPFHRYLNRCMILLALAGLWPLLRLAGGSFRLVLRPVPRAQLGREWLLGATFGIATLAAVVLLAVGAGARDWNLEHTPYEFGRRFTGALAAALVVGLLEEMLFRGGLFAALRRSCSFSAAACFSSFIYALTHFLARPINPLYIDGLSGFHALSQMLAGFGDISALVPGLFNLFLLGWLLAWLFERTGSLACSIGLHFAMVLFMKTYGFITQPQPGASLRIWGSHRIVDGWMSGALLLLLTGVALWWFRESRQTSEDTIHSPSCGRPESA